MRIGILTSSRADYGIYYNLVEELIQDNFFEVEFIVFGMHLQEHQGFTLSEVQKRWNNKIHIVNGMPDEDDVHSIIQGYGRLIINFADFWLNNSFDIILALGDRWEMSAAVQSTIPYELNIGHIHGGETTLGAIDNTFRHQISLASKLHFTTTDTHRKKVIELIGTDKNVYNVGSISLDNLNITDFTDWESCKEEFRVPFDDFILVTIHPESINSGINRNLAEITFSMLENLVQKNNILITKANSDPNGSLFNYQTEKLEALYPSKIKVIKSLGRTNYFRAMNQSKYLIGNTSSGIIEAASFNKWVLNLGNRQNGRVQSKNVINKPFALKEIMRGVAEIENQKGFYHENLYQKDSTVKTIVKILKNYSS